MLPELEIIARVHSPFKEKFGIPRQPGLIDNLQSKIVFEPKFNEKEYIQGIEANSHIWLIFSFHQNLEQGYKAQVRPPRLGGNQKLGVFATRATFRPNGMGMSAVKLLKVETQESQISLVIEGADLLDGTPILDIKPYIPYSDSISTASSEFAEDAPSADLDVNFSELAESQLAQLNNQQYPNVKQIISGVLRQDPRPAYKKNKPDDKEYGIRLYDLNIKWHVNEQTCFVLSIEKEQSIHE